MNKKSLSLGALALILILWFVAPVYAAGPLSLTTLDLLDLTEICGLADYLLILAPIAAVVLGAIGIFMNSGLNKIGGFIGAGGMALSFILILVDGATSALAWGFWGLLILCIANLVINLKAE